MARTPPVMNCECSLLLAICSVGMDSAATDLGVSTACGLMFASCTVLCRQMAAAIVAAFDQEIAGMPELHDVDLSDDGCTAGPVAESERHITVPRLRALASKLGLIGGAAMVIFLIAAPRMIKLTRMLSGISL